MAHNNWGSWVCSFAFLLFPPRISAKLNDQWTYPVCIFFFLQYWHCSNFLLVIWNIQLTFHWLQYILDQVLKWTSGCKFISQGLAGQFPQTKCLQTFFALILFECLGMKNKIIIKKKVVVSGKVTVVPSSNVSAALIMSSPAVLWSCYFLFRSIAQHISGYAAQYTGFTAQLS